MGDQDPKKTTDVGYKTEIPDDILDAAVGSVDKRIEEAKEDEASDSVEVATEDPEDALGIDIDVDVPDGPVPEAPEQAADIVADTELDDDGEEVTPSPDEEVTPSPEGDPLPAMTVEELLEAGKVLPQVVEFLESESERARAAQERMLRALAETENTRRRLARQQEEAVKYANGDLVKNLLPVLDNLILCLENSDTGDAERLREGVEMTLRQWYKLFQKIGVNKVEAELGSKFDPNVHEAVMQDPESDQPANTIAKVLQTGFTYHDRLLRPTMVSVATGEGADAVDPQEPADEPVEEAVESDAPATDQTDEAWTNDDAESDDDTAGEPENTTSDAEEQPVAPPDEEAQDEPTKTKAKSGLESATAEENKLFEDDDLDDWADGVDTVQTDDA